MSNPTAAGPRIEYERIETVRGIIRMAALVVMEECGETDRALATAIAAKAALDLRTHFSASQQTARAHCLHVFPDGTLCTLSEHAHRSVVELAQLHGFPEAADDDGAHVDG